MLPKDDRIIISLTGIPLFDGMLKLLKIISYDLMKAKEKGNLHNCAEAKRCRITLPHVLTMAYDLRRALIKKNDIEEVSTKTLDFLSAEVEKKGRSKNPSWRIEMLKSIADDFKQKGR
jgi:hypothetical protein